MRNMFPSCHSEVEPDVTGLADAAVSRRQPRSTNHPVSARSVPGTEGAVSRLGKVCTSVRKKEKKQPVENQQE